MSRKINPKIAIPQFQEPLEIWRGWWMDTGSEASKNFIACLRLPEDFFSSYSGGVKRKAVY